MEIKIENRINEIPRLNEMLADYAENKGMSEELVFQIRLALEEMITNTIKYGYDGAERHIISIIVEIDQNKLTIEVEDDANPFNPMDHEPRNLSGDMEDWDIGGLGIHMVKQLMDDIEYRREAGVNKLKLTKKIINKSEGKEET